jgi:hypothetical protein
MIPVFFQSFPDEDSALEYAIHNQRNRRNLTDAELLRCIEVLDRRKERGGDRKSEEFQEKIIIVDKTPLAVRIDREIRAEKFARGKA